MFREMRLLVYRLEVAIILSFDHCLDVVYLYREPSTYWIFGQYSLKIIALF